ncbi:hypothetical protein D3C85_1611960 [compost metagenome]
MQPVDRPLLACGHVHLHTEVASQDWLAQLLLNLLEKLLVLRQYPRFVLDVACSRQTLAHPPHVKSGSLLPAVLARGFLSGRGQSLLGGGPCLGDVRIDCGYLGALRRADFGSGHTAP